MQQYATWWRAWGSCRQWRWFWLWKWWWRWKILIVLSVLIKMKVDWFFQRYLHLIIVEYEQWVQIILSKCINMSKTMQNLLKLDYLFHWILLSTLVAKTVSCNRVEFYIISRHLSYNQLMWAEWVKLSKLLIFNHPSLLAYHSHLKVPQIIHNKHNVVLLWRHVILNDLIEHLE